MPADKTFESKMAALQSRLEQLPGAVVAFSGGVDSAMLLHASQAALGDRVVAVTADSPSLPRAELADASLFAEEHGIEHIILDTDELRRLGYRDNAPDRCFFCKTELFEAIAAEIGRVSEAGWPVLYGAILDDDAEHRPGAQAARQHGVLAPLTELSICKAEVRQYSRSHGLATAEKPSFACLASRIPYGTRVTAELLSQLEQAENVLRELGYQQFRVRHHGTVARIELLPEDFHRAVSTDREAMTRGIRAAGYLYVSLDLTGYRTGAMNETLA